MSVESLALVLHHSQAKGTDKVVLIGIANHDGDGGAWPTLATLAKYARVDPRTVQRSLRRLVELGELRVEEQGGGTPDVADWKRPNLYQLLVSCPPGCDRSKRHRVTDLPKAAADLWKDRVTPTSPGDANVTPRVTPTSGEGVTPASPKPSIEPSMNGSGSDTASTTDRASAAAAEVRRHLRLAR